MDQFQSWTSFLSDHASDADYRKNSDPNEGERHYIDIDNYDSFIQTGRIPQTFDSAVQKYGFTFVKNQGILPWATTGAFDSLRECFKRYNWVKAQVFAADLGHYVADGHMPLHITKNFDGQLTGASGIHSRYESTMIGSYVNQIIYTGEPAVKIDNVPQYVFNYLYANYKCVDSVLLADAYARSLSSNTSSSTYKQALWEKSKSFTIPLFKNASNALANLIYTAWVDAGSPEMNVTGTAEIQTVDQAVLNQNMPNPFTGSTHIHFKLKEEARVLMQVHDSSGQTIETLLHEKLQPGEHSIEWMPGHIAPGMYYLVLDTGKSIQIKKMLYSGSN